MGSAAIYKGGQMLFSLYDPYVATMLRARDDSVTAVFRAGISSFLALLRQKRAAPPLGESRRIESVSNV